MNRREDAAVLPDRPTGRAGEVFLQPGEYFTGGGTRVRTLLGSCVSITLWHPQRCVGAMSHFVLATRGKPPAADEPLDARYGDEALALMVRELALLGVRASECEGKVFGGGDMFPEQAILPGMVAGVGRRNGEAARRLLEEHGVTVRSHHLYGHGHRQVIFDLLTGHVWVRHVRAAGLNDARPRRIR